MFVRSTKSCVNCLYWRLSDGQIRTSISFANSSSTVRTVNEAVLHNLWPIASQSKTLISRCGHKQQTGVISVGVAKKQTEVVSVKCQCCYFFSPTTSPQPLELLRSNYHGPVHLVWWLKWSDYTMVLMTIGKCRSNGVLLNNNYL